MAFSAFSRSRRSAGGGPDGPLPEPPVATQGVTDQDVVLVYEAVLGRSPSPDEIAHQQANAASLRDLLVAMAAQRRVRPIAASEPAEPQQTARHPSPPT